MHKPVIASALILGAALGAQSPLTTTFAGGNGLTASGSTQYFDLNVKSGIAVTQMDCNIWTGGTSTTINVWTIPGTHVGNESSSSGWTLVGSATNAAPAANGTPTPFTFTTAIPLSPGAIGVAIEYVGDGMAYTNGTAVGNLYTSTNELDFLEGGSGNTLFTGLNFSPRIWNGSIYYQSLVGFATSTPFGQGCGGVFESASLYERTDTASLDFSGAVGSETVYSMLGVGSGFVVLPIGPAWFTPTSADLALTLDAITGPIPLGFTFTYADAAGAPRQTQDIWICANGYILLENPNNLTLGDWTPTGAELVAQEARLCPLWGELRTLAGGGGGTVHFDIDPATGNAVVTWLGIQEYATPAGTHTFQVVIAPTSFEFRYQVETGTTAGGTHPLLVGFSPGNGALDPGSVDISAGGSLVTQPDRFVPNLTLSTDRPVEGTTMAVNISGIPAGTLLGATVLSGIQVLPGVQPIPGLGDCFQFVGLDDVFYFNPTGSTATLNYPIPATGFTGSTFELQAVSFSPGVNPVGLATSNGVTLVVDIN